MATARANPPSDHVPYAFEKRVMALLEAPSVPDAREMWARALWRGAFACVGLTLLLGAFMLSASPAPSATDLSQDFENTLFAAVAEDGDSVW